MRRFGKAIRIWDNDVGVEGRHMLYRLTPPLVWKQGKRQRHTAFVRIDMAAEVDVDEKELRTYVFAADASGRILDDRGLKGSYYGRIDPVLALGGIGYREEKSS